MSLYHSKVYMPNFDLPKGNLKLIYTYHAIEEALKDGYEYDELPKSINTELSEIIEIETDNNDIPKKILYRLPFTYDLDICLVVLINESNVVKTVWLNYKNDTHRTFNPKRYVQKPLDKSKVMC